ncbi:hypothetical protein GGF42_006915 [Coemansia sp. RSA 2424]|nr:hypothetical protein GGF42_006915 [Coemansia sp. RSA 2424]
MSLSLVPEYASSDSDSGAEEELRDVTEQIPARTTVAKSAQPIPPASRELAAKLASVLPPPKNRATTDASKVRIVVDLGQPSQTKVRPDASEPGNPPAVAPANQSDGSTKHPAGGLFSELLSILPAPKNSRLGAPAIAKPGSSGSGSGSGGMDRATAKAVTASKPLTVQSLIPHSISSKRRGKPPATLAKGKAAANVAAQSHGADSGSESESDEAVEEFPAGSSGPFFTIDAAEPKADKLIEGRVAHVVDLPAESCGDDEASGSASMVQAQPTTSELHYDPNSGYYYSYVSERYYYYDASSGEYIDAQSLYAHDSQALGSEAPGNTDDLSDQSRIDQSDLQRLIGRGALKRGEMHEMASAAIRDVSQAAQLQSSGYSDTRMAHEFSAKRSAEQQRQESKHIIVSDEADKKKKKSKNNIMYLALQAQEQDAKLKDAHANRQRAKRAARAKYGY